MQWRELNSKKDTIVIKILFYIPTLAGGGAEKVLRTLVNNMNLSSFDIEVATYEQCDSSQYLKQGIKYKAINHCKTKAGKIAFNLVYRLFTELRLTYFLWLRGSYDIEIAFLECGATKVIAGSTNKHAIKLAWVHCDLLNRLGDSRKFASNTRRYYMHYDEVVCVSESVTKSFEMLYGNVAKAITLYNAVDEKEILEKAEFNVKTKKNRLTLVLVGRLSPQKRIDRLLIAQQRLLKEGVDCDVWILGEGEEREKLEGEIKELKLEDRAFLLGFQQNPYPYMKVADLLVCSSVYEGYSTFITEGLILGKPIITTDVSGMRELLGDSEYGMITLNDDEDFYVGLKRMLTIPNLLEYYRNKSELRGKEFQLKKTVSMIESHLTDLLSDKV